MLKQVETIQDLDRQHVSKLITKQVFVLYVFLCCCFLFHFDETLT